MNKRTIEVDFRFKNFSSGICFKHGETSPLNGQHNSHHVNALSRLCLNKLDMIFLGEGKHSQYSQGYDSEIILACLYAIFQQDKFTKLQN